MSHNTTGIKIKTRSKRRSLKAKDPVEVFCRIRPSEEVEPNDTEDETYTRCIEHISDTVIQLNPPRSSLAFKAGNKTATQHTFKFVFQETATQKKVFDHVARPLVYDQLNGKNGLLFTYGITNSGKTYTMSGSHDNSGILPRCLDVIFNSVSELLAKPFVFKSDRLNGFNVQSEEDAGKEYRGFRRKKLKGKLEEDSDEPCPAVDRVADESLISGLDEDNAYAVFVSYFEIYNNYVYDLFEDIQVEGGKVKPPQSKMLREDARHNMYVSGGVEVEVRNTKDTFSLIEKGQKNRRMAETQLNHNSSRSHAIFNIRVVQAPLDPNGEEVYLDKDKVNVSTLSLVDLAGSERTSRTQADGIQLKEAGSINASLMVLRNCMETLRDNQTNGPSKIVPFRDSKLTHLFKNFFDGEGKVRMVVCVNPRTADYDETIHVLRFSELTQNVVVDRSEGLKVDGLGLAPGRRRANMLYKIQLKELEEVLKDSNKGTPQALHPSVPAKLKFTHTPTDSADPTTSEASSEETPFRVPPPRVPPKPSRYLTNKLLPPLDIEKLLMRSIPLSEYSKMLQDQVRIKKRIKHELRQKQIILRKRLIDMGEELDTLNSLLSKAKTQVSTKEREMTLAGEKMRKLAKSNDQLHRTNEMLRLNCKELQEESQEKDSKVSQEREKREKLRTFLMNRVTAEKVDWENKLRLKVQKTEEEYMSTIREQANMIQDQQCMLEQLKDIVLDKEENGLERRYRTPASHRKRPSSDNNKWLQHNPSDSVKVDTLMQPNFKRKKTVQNPSSKVLSGKSIDRYVLTHQEEASDGDVMTHLYKGDVTRTRGGGTAVKFTDVEMLENIDTHGKNSKDFKVSKTPHTPHPKTRVGDRRFSLALEGHQSGAPPGIVNRVV